MPWPPNSGTSSTPFAPVPSSYASTTNPPATVTRRATGTTGDRPHRTVVVAAGGGRCGEGRRAAKDAALDAASAKVAATATTPVAMRADRRYITSDIVLAGVRDVKDSAALATVRYRIETEWHPGAGARVAHRPDRRASAPA